MCKCERVGIEVHEDLNLWRRAELQARLLQSRGISRAYFDTDNLRRLTVDYDPTWFSQVTLIDLIRQQRINAEVREVVLSEGDSLPEVRALRTATGEEATVTRHPDSYAGAVPTDEIYQVAKTSAETCGDEGDQAARQCAHTAVQSLMCPCAVSDAIIVDEVAEEFLREMAKDVRERKALGHDRLERVLDVALADTFPASDPVALLSPHR